MCDSVTYFTMKFNGHPDNIFFLGSMPISLHISMLLENDMTPKPTPKTRNSRPPLKPFIPFAAKLSIPIYGAKRWMRCSSSTC